MKKVTYIRCPRCELNYITKDEKFCSICKQEMLVGGGETVDEEDLELCPICKSNYIQPDDLMCPNCFAERMNDPNYDGDSEWDEYINRDEREEDYNDSQDEEIGDMSSVKDLDLDDDLELPDDDLDVISDEDEEKDDFDEDEDFSDELDDDDFDEDFDDTDDDDDDDE